MQTKRRRCCAVMLGAALLPGLCLATTTAARAFQVGRSPDFAGCNIWFNDRGEPLRNKIGREIGEEAPCAGQVAHDSYKVVLGSAANTLVIQDQSHQLECVLALVPGSRTVMVPVSCKPFKP